MWRAGCARRRQRAPSNRHTHGVHSILEFPHFESCDPGMSILELPSPCRESGTLVKACRHVGTRAYGTSSGDADGAHRLRSWPRRRFLPAIRLLRLQRPSTPGTARKIGLAVKRALTPQRHPPRGARAPAVALPPPHLPWDGEPAVSQGAAHIAANDPEIPHRGKPSRTVSGIAERPEGRLRGVGREVGHHFGACEPVVKLDRELVPHRIPCPRVVVDRRAHFLDCVQNESAAHGHDSGQRLERA